MQAYNLITVLGHTAGGKTTFASHLAHRLGSEIISADSRQVYKGMDIGTGKDLADYQIAGKKIPYHLIDICEAGERYNVYEYQKDFIRVFNRLEKEQKMPILCGGTGLYIDAVINNYRLIQVPVNQKLRDELEKKTLEELSQILANEKQLHNTSDTDTKKRAIRAIEIARHYQKHPEIDRSYPEIRPLILGIKFDRNSRRRRISQRLRERLDEGMIEEVENLLKQGVSHETLVYYGLEYKFISLHLSGDLSYQVMFKKLETAIHQFAKRQMTWYRRMEKQGKKIHWLDGYMPLNEKLSKAISLLNQ